MAENLLFQCQDIRRAFLDKEDFFAAFSSSCRATDLKAMKLYYRTAWNSNIRCIDLMDIDFKKIKFQSHPLDDVQQQPVTMVRVKS